MPRYNVTCGDDKWACFSTVTNGFVTEFVPREQYEEWRRSEYGDRVASIENSNNMTLKEALNKAYLKSADANDFVNHLVECGLMTDYRK